MNTFEFNGKELDEFIHPYNRTSNNERKIELAIAFDWIETTDLLEIGCVLPYYGVDYHTVIDPYDPHSQAINIEVEEFHPERKSGQLISISTLEHIGLPEYGRTVKPIENTIKIIDRFDDWAEQWLYTIPIGYNKSLDEYLKDRPAKYMLQIARGEWRQADYWEVEDSEYNRPYPYANAVAFYYGGK